jgi:hypothetical protein
MKTELNGNLLVRAPLRRNVRELPAGKPKQGTPRRSVSELSTSQRSKLWETVCWLQGSISSVQRLRWPMSVGSSCRRLQRTSLFRWRAVSQRSLCVDNRSLLELAKSEESRESRQNLPFVEVRNFRSATPRGSSRRILNLTARKVVKPSVHNKGKFCLAFLVVVFSHSGPLRLSALFNLGIV